MSLGDVFDAAFDLYKNNWSLFVGICAVIQVPALIVWHALPYSLGMDKLDRMSRTNADDFVQAMFGYLGAVLVIILVQSLLYVLQSGALSLAVSSRYLNRTAGVFSSYRQVARSFFRLLVTWIVVAIGLGGFMSVFMALLAFMLGLLVMSVQTAGGPMGEAFALTLGVMFWLIQIPVFIAAVVIAGLFVTQIVVVERTGYFGAVIRNLELVVPNFPRLCVAAFALSIILPALCLALDSSVSAILELIVYPWLHPPMLARAVASGIGSGVILLFVQPYVMICLTLLYYDQRVRREGFDLALLDRQLLSTVAATTAERAA